MTTVLAPRLPDASGVAQIGASVRSGIGTLTEALEALSSGAERSPFAALTGRLGDLKLAVSVDTGKLTTELPDTLSTLSAALPPSALDYARSIEADFDEARRLLADSAVARAVADGQSLQEVALAAVQDALAEFDSRRAELLQGLLPEGELEEVKDLLTALDQLASDYAAHRAELLPFLSRYLVGQSPELLAPVLGHVEQALAPLQVWRAEAVEALIGAPARALTEAQRDLLTELSTFAPASEAAFDALDANVDAVRAALPPLCTALAQLYTQVDTALRSQALDEVLDAYVTLLDAIDLDAVPVPADAVQALAEVLETLLSRLEAQFTPADVAAKIQALAAALHTLFEESPLGQVRGAIRDFLSQIVAGIEAIPTDKISGTVQQVLQQVGDQIDRLDLAQAADQIEAAFEAVETFVRDHLNEALGEQLGNALQGLLDNLDALPIATLVDNVEQLIAQLEQAIAELTAALDEAMAQLSELAARLDELTFKPVGDAVVAEIDELRAKLAAINPNALSEVEKVALQGALAVVRAVDLEGIVQREVKQGFGSARDTALAGLEEVTAVLEGVREHFEQFSPQRLVQDLVAILGGARQTVDALEGRAIMRPFYGQIDQLAGLLGQAHPGALLEPLQQPYQTVLGAVEQLRPDRLVEPLTSIYARIDQLIDKVDVVPLLEELERREKALLGDVRQAIVQGLEAVQLPPPLDGFYAQVRPVLQGMTEALLADPSVELRRLGLDLSTRFKPSDLFVPLDQLHARLMELVGAVPAADLEAAFNTLRTGLGVGLDTLDPRRLTAALSAGRGELAALSPRVQLSGVLQTPALQASFELRVAGAPAHLQARVAGSRTRLAALVARVEGDGSLVTPLLHAHDTLDAALGRRLAALDTASAQASYGRLDSKLRRLLPDFLFSPQPLTHADILSALLALRPSAQADALDAQFARFQARVKTMQEQLDPAFAGFFNALREPLQMLSPLAIRDDVADVYTALRSQVRVIDPEALAADLHQRVYDPVHTALAAVDPEKLGERLQAAYDTALAAVTDNLKALLDRVASALDTQLQRLREAVGAVVSAIEAALQQAAQVFDGLLERLEHLVLVEVLERLKRLVRTLGLSFEQEVDRVVSAFERMLSAIPLGGGAETVEVSP